MIYVLAIVTVFATSQVHRDKRHRNVRLIRISGETIATNHGRGVQGCKRAPQSSLIPAVKPDARARRHCPVDDDDSN